MHRDSPGYEKIERGKYVISDEDAGGALIRRDKWPNSFRPGKHIGLSFLLKHPGARDNRECPRCKTLKTTPGYHEGQKRWYSNSLTVQKKILVLTITLAVQSAISHTKLRIESKQN